MTEPWYETGSYRAHVYPENSLMGTFSNSCCTEVNRDIQVLKRQYGQNENDESANTVRSTLQSPALVDVEVHRTYWLMSSFNPTYNPFVSWNTVEISEVNWEGFWHLFQRQ